MVTDLGEEFDALCDVTEGRFLQLHLMFELIEELKVGLWRSAT